MTATTDPEDPRLTHGVDEEPVPQAEAYLVLSEQERTKGFVRPVRHAYRHIDCGAITSMTGDIAETYARNPGFYGATYCTGCRMHLPVDEFLWLNHDGTTSDEKVGS